MGINLIPLFQSEDSKYEIEATQSGIRVRILLITGLVTSLARGVALCLRACPCKNRPLKFWWKIDCPHFFYTSQAIYAMNENSLYFARFAFFIFSRFFFVGKLKTTQNRKLKPHILVFTRCLLKTRTFNKTT